MNGLLINALFRVIDSVVAWLVSRVRIIWHLSLARENISALRRRKANKPRELNERKDQIRIWTSLFPVARLGSLAYSVHKWYVSRFEVTRGPDLFRDTFVEVIFSQLGTCQLPAVKAAHDDLNVENVYMGAFFFFPKTRTRLLKRIRMFYSWHSPHGFMLKRNRKRNHLYVAALLTRKC